MVCQPVAPSGTTPVRTPVWVYPLRSVARTASLWEPGGTSTEALHCTQVSTVGTLPSCASVHGPPSSRYSTRSIPVCCAQATPPTFTVPDSTSAPPRGTSIRDCVFTGALADHPREVQ